MPHKSSIEIIIDDNCWQEKYPECDEVCIRAAQITLDCLKVPALHCDTQTCITLSNNAHIQELNKQYRNKDKPTNVLSFPIEEFTYSQLQEVCLQHKDRPFMLGDIVLAFETVEQQSQAESIKFYDHLAHLVIHGTLHLLGYDHIQDDEAANMQQLEKEILMSLDIGDPYADER